MDFTFKEKQAIATLLFVIIKADGQFDTGEKTVLLDYAKRFEMSVIELMMSVSGDEKSAALIVRDMPAAKRETVRKYLWEMAEADGDVSADEFLEYIRICAMCDIEL